MPQLTPPLVSDALRSPAYAAHFTTPLLRALFHLDTALFEVPTGKVADELRMAREAALGELSDAERRTYSERVPADIAEAAHASSMHALALRPLEVCGMLGGTKQQLKRWEALGLLPAWRHPFARGCGQPERRYRASDVIAFCVRYGVPVPPALLPGASASDMPPEAFAKHRGTARARRAGRKSAARHPSRLERENNDELELSRLRRAR